MTHIAVRGLHKQFGDFTAVQGVNFEIEKGKLIGLLGPSGGGKTTILRMLAGLERPDRGEILFHGHKVNHLPPQERGIGFVFQNYALFKHMTVFENIAFGLSIQKKSKSDIAKRVEEMIELIGLQGLGKRYPHQLSGGQRQRVAFARALAPQPQLLLLDEPFAAIDAKVRKELRTWLKDMINKVGVTSIFVTHDQEEAVEVADEIMIMNAGRLEQKGTPWDVYKEPQTSFVAGFIGDANLITDPTRLKGFQTGITTASGNTTDAKAYIRPEYIEIGREHEISVLRAAETAIVRQIQFRGNAWHIEVELGNERLIAHRSLEKEPLQPGDHVHILIHRIHLFHHEQNRLIENALKIGSAAV